MKITTTTFGDIELLDFTTLDDAMKGSILEIRNHSKVREQMHSQDIIDKNDHLKFIASLKGNNYKKYFVAKYEQRLLGVIYFTDIDEKDRSAVFGIYANLLEKRDKIGSILMETALIYFKDILSFKTLNLEVYESNQRAAGLYLKFGFVVDDHFYQDSHKVLNMKWVKSDL
nr:UDP-4-amino-4,6-dideoxy-N-acetyl-beta-L-altrosamine N-acetyltransferase [uncultured Psychrobacter sp.]